MAVMPFGSKTALAGNYKGPCLACVFKLENRSSLRDSSIAFM